jgi:putative transposase
VGYKNPIGHGPLRIARRGSIAAMLASLLYLLLRRLLALGASHDRSDQAAQIEILVLRHQLEVLRRQVKRPVYRHRDRALLGAASRILPRDRWDAFLVRPETLLRWHRSLVARKWTWAHRPPGRPAIDPEVRKLILQMASENPRWGYLRIKGELAKLGLRVSATSIATLLRRARIGPAPRRGPTWRQFLKAQASGILACDFFTVETAFLQTLYVLFFIEIGTRRVQVTVSTKTPDAAFVTQQARNLVMRLPDDGTQIRFLIRDRDTKFSRSFDEVFASEGIRVIRTPIRAPNANAFAERWIETLRAECLDWLLILGPGHLDRVLRIYIQHYNRQRPHRALELRAPEADAPVEEAVGRPAIERQDLLGGLVHEYRRAA